MAKYVVTYTGANGIKAYASETNANGDYAFTFTKDEAGIYDYSFDAINACRIRKDDESFFIHDENAATLPAGLTWQVETI